MECGACQRYVKRDGYSRSQWERGSRCRECVDNDFFEQDDMFECEDCGDFLPDYLREDDAPGDLCKGCVVRRVCFSCGQTQPSYSFSITQLSKGNQARCKDCVYNGNTDNFQLVQAQKRAAAAAAQRAADEAKRAAAERAAAERAAAERAAAERAAAERAAAERAAAEQRERERLAALQRAAAAERERALAAQRATEERAAANRAKQQPRIERTGFAFVEQQRVRAAPTSVDRKKERKRLELRLAIKYEELDELHERLMFLGFSPMDKPDAREKKYEDDDDDDEDIKIGPCAICQERARDALFKRCHHVSCCFTCAQKTGNKCPICRQHSAKITRLYFS